ncbi:MAG: hypothetical protein FWB90_00570 [Fibromonadales bacterium]|nr:hypothetical protein [Fibromonadales bacterium]
MADFRNLMQHTMPMEAPTSTTFVAPFQMPTPEEFARREARKKKDALLQDYEQNYARQYDDYMRANSSNLGAFVPLKKLSIDDWVKLKNNVVDAAINMRTAFLTSDMKAQIQQTPLKEASVAENAGALLGRASDNLTSGVRDWIHSVTDIGYSQKEQGVERANRVQENIDLEKKLNQIRADIEVGNEVSDEDYELLQEHDAPFMQQLIRGIKDTPEFVQELATNPDARDMFVDESIRQLPANIGFMAAIKSPLASVGNQLKVLSRVAKLRRANKKAADAVRESRFKELAKDAAAATVAGAVTEYAHGLGEQSQESPGYTAGQGIVLDGLVPLAVSQIGKGMSRRIAGDGNKSGTEAENAQQTETAEDPRFSLIGERGAEFSDFNNNTTEKKDKLITAKEMEASGKNPSQIHYATGWEKGADGKWKYEIPDFTLKTDTFHRNRMDLGEIVKDEGGLFKAYPELKDVSVNIQLDNPRHKGSYNTKTNEITINGLLKGDDFRKSLLHEVQHAIQEIEGFAKGGNLDNTYADVNVANQISMVEHVITKAMNKQESFNKKNDANFPLSEFIDDFRGEIPIAANRSEIIQWATNLANAGEDAISEFLKETPRQRYFRLAGEVEARNVAKRSGISENVRDMIPLHQTEDVPRNVQIVRFHAASEAGISESHDTPEAREAARKAWREKGTDSPFFKRWFGDSKVVDEQGKPLVVYHGARTSKRFNKFDDGMIFFTDNYDIAEMFNDHYAYKLIVDKKEYPISSGEARNIQMMIEPYEDLDYITSEWNLLDAKSIEDFNDLIESGGIQAGIDTFDGVKTIEVKPNHNVYEVYLDIKNPKIIDMKGKEWSIEAEKFDWTFGDHDGIIVKNVIEGGPVAELLDGSEVPPATNYIVKNSSQIKSATDNAGTFDGSNPDIRYHAQPSLGEWPEGFKITQLTTVPKMKSHADYDAAKAGNNQAAIRLARDILNGKDERLLAIAERHPNAILVAVHTEEKSGKNKIPQMLAKTIGKKTNLEVDTDIVQVNKVGHTGADAWHRLATRAEFQGEVQPGRQYILIDDVVTGGGTLGELRHFIESNGGEVVDMVTAGAAQFSTNIALSKQTQTALENKFNPKEFSKFLLEENLYGGNYKSLTESEARLILGTGSLDRARDRIAKARQEAGISGSGHSSSRHQAAEISHTPKPIPKSELNKLISVLQKNGLAVEVITDKDKFEGAISKHFATPDGTIYGYATTDGRIGLNPDKMNANTPMHEYGHLWIDFVKRNNKGLYNEIARLALQTDEFQQLMQNPAYSSLTAQQRAEEAIATIIGNKGEAAFHNAPKGLQAKLKQLIAELWQWIKEQFGHSSNIRSLTPEQIQNMTFDELMGKAAEDIAAGRRIANDTPNKELDFNLWRHTMTDQEEPTGGEQVDNAAPANTESQTPETKVDDDALFSDDPDKVREQLKNVSHDKPLTRQEKKEEKLKERLGPDYAPPADRILKKGLGLTSADIKKLQEESHKHKEASEDEKTSEVDRAVSKLRSEQAEEKAEAAYKEFISGIEQEFGDAQKVDPAFKEQATFYAPELDKLKHTHELQRAIMDRSDRVAVMKAIYTVLDYTDEKTDVNNWEAFKMLPPEKQLEQLNGILSAIDNTASRRVKKTAPQVPANIPQPGSGMSSTGSGKYNFNDTDDTWEWLAAQKKRGLA